MFYIFCSQFLFIYIFVLVLIVFITLVIILFCILIFLGAFIRIQTFRFIIINRSFFDDSVMGIVSVFFIVINLSIFSVEGRQVSDNFLQIVRSGQFALVINFNFLSGLDDFQFFVIIYIIIQAGSFIFQGGWRNLLILFEIFFSSFVDSDIYQEWGLNYLSDREIEFFF